MKEINEKALLATCDKLYDRCIDIAGSHNRSWLYERLVEYFKEDDAVEAVTIPVVFNTPLLGEKGEATIGRNGLCVMRRKE